MKNFHFHSRKIKKNKIIALKTTKTEQIAKIKIFTFFPPYNICVSFFYLKLEEKYLFSKNTLLKSHTVC